MIYVNKSLMQILALVLVFAPIEYKIEGVNVSINYLFVLVFLIISKCRFSKLSKKVIFIYIILFSSLIFGGINILLTQSNPAELVAKMLFSWVLVASPYLILIYKIEIDGCLLKKSLLTVAIVYSMYALTMLFNDYFLKGVYFPQMIKAGMAETMPEWPDRFSPVLILSAFLLYYDKYFFSKKFKILGLLLISIVIVFTFSRAIYIGVAFVCFLKFTQSVYMRKIDCKSFRFAASLFAILFLLAYTFENVSEILGNFYDFIYASFDTLSESAGDINSSAGARLDRIDYISTVLLQSPLGFGGLGISNINSNYGSAESQYIDYLVRFGFLGLVLVIYIQLRAYSKAKEIKELSGYAEYIVFLMVFGVFHETIRLPNIAMTVLILDKIHRNNNKFN